MCVCWVVRACISITCKLRLARGNPSAVCLCVWAGCEKVNAPTRAQLPTPPVEPSLSAYWMAIEGVQPAGLAGAAAAQHPGDNAAGPPVSATAAAPTGGPAAVPAAAATSESIVKNMLSKELQLYYDSVTEAVMSGTAAQREAAIASLGMDSGLQELVPYFSLFVSEKVTANLRNLEVLLALMRTVFSLLTNPEIYLDPYVHQLMPAILTCVVGKRLCADPVENHWKLRDYAAELVALACRKFGAAYATLQPRITKTLLSAFVNPSRPLTTHYGAVVALTALGPHTIHTLLLPNLRSYMNKLEPELSSAAQNNPRKRAEAAKCHGALMMAAGAYLSKYWMVFSPPPPAAPEPTPTPQVAAAASSGATAAAAPMDVEEPKAAAATEEASVRLEHAPPVPKKRGLMDNYKLPRKKAKPAPVAAATASAAADAPVKLELAPPAGAGAGAAGGALLPQHAVAYEELFEIFGDQLAPFLPVNSGLPLLQLS